MKELETLIFFRWVIRGSKWIEIFNWINEKVGFRFQRLQNTRSGKQFYPDEIKLLIPCLKTGRTEEEMRNIVKPTPEITFDPPKTLLLAGSEISVSDGRIEWCRIFADPEDEVSLHRWNWLLHLASETRCSQGRLQWMLAMLEDWVERFQQEVSLPSRKLDQLLRWDSYTVGERLANTVLFFHCYNLSPSNILEQALKEQARLLTTRLEYFGSLTGNHICNNARALYLAGVFFRCETLQHLAREVFGLELQKLVNRDGFLREGSSHYHLLFTRWMLEVHYFALQNADEELLELLRPVLDGLLTQCSFFRIEIGKGQSVMPLFGDISPDFSPEWLIDILRFPGTFINGQEELPSQSWGQLWPKNSHPLYGLSASKILKEYGQKSRIYPNSGWYRFQHGEATLFLRADPEGVPSYASHYHQDAGHFCLYLKKRPLLVDGGRLNYMNNFGLGPEAHNSLMLEGIGLVPRKPHRFPRGYANNRQSVTHRVEKVRLEVMFTSDGFTRLQHGLNWQRIWQLYGNEIRIKDTLGGTGSMAISIWFHWAAGAEIIRMDDSSWRIVFPDTEILFQICSTLELRRTVHHGGDSPLGWQVVAYGRRLPAATIELEGTVKLPTTIEYSLTF